MGGCPCHLNRVRVDAMCSFRKPLCVHSWQARAQILMYFRREDIMRYAKN